MPTPEPELSGYAVTLEVFVPVEVARRMVDRLDARWHNESWGPESAAYMVVREALEAVGLHRLTDISTTSVTS
jgi:hypothetical protein